MDVNYNDGKWHGWNGGECPVHRDSMLTVKWRTGGEIDVTDREGLVPRYWQDGEIVAFRVVKEYREPPKEYTIDPRKDFIWYSCEDGLVHVREVLP